MSALYRSAGHELDRMVRLPHPADAIGTALRGVFTCPALPDDMATLLRQLNRPGGTSRPHRSVALFSDRG